MTVSCCPIKCFMIKQNVRERLFDYSLEGLFSLQFLQIYGMTARRQVLKYYYYVVACKNGTTYNWKPSDNKYDDDEYDGNHKWMQRSSNSICFQHNNWQD